MKAHKRAKKQMHVNEMEQSTTTKIKSNKSEGIPSDICTYY